MIKNVVFDMGNVILRWDPQYIAEKLSNNEKEKKLLLMNYLLLNNGLYLMKVKLVLKKRLLVLAQSIVNY